MEEKLKNIIKQKANEFELEPHVDDWLIIDRQLEALEKRRKLRLMPYIAAAAIAMLLVVGGLLWFVDKDIQDLTVEQNNQPQKTEDEPVKTTVDSSGIVKITPDKVEQTLILAEVDNNKKHKTPEKGKASGAIVEEIVKTKRNGNTKDLPLMPKNKTKDQIASIDDPVTVVTAENTEEALKNENKAKNEENKERSYRYWEDNEAESSFKLLKKDENVDNLSVGLMFASNSSWGENMGKTYNSSHIMHSSALAAYELKNYAIDNYGSLNNYRASHNFPLSFGLSVRKNINRHFAFKIGLVYSYLQSTFTLSTTKKVQKLHYIGVPLSGVVTIKKFGNFSIYLSGGGMVEKNIVGRLTDKSKYGSGETVKFTDNKLQWSVNANAGMNYQFYKKLSLYVEPGWSYYFDNGSDIRNYRTKHPSSFNFQAGFQFSL